MTYVKPFVVSNDCLICGHREADHYCEEENGNGYHGDDWCSICANTAGVGSQGLHHHQYLNAQKRVKELEAALFPFANIADTMSTFKDEQTIFGHFTVKQFRDAFKALEDLNNDF